jgi:hypothetical protein
MKSLGATLLAVVLIAGASSAFAQGAGHVQTKAKTDNVTQSNQGKDNVNKLKVGSVETKGLRVRGDVRTEAAAGRVTQTNRGQDNENEIKIGTVE